MPAMKLRIVKTDKGTHKIYLDEVPLHHVEGYKIESSTITGKAELSLRMLVEFPAISESGSKQHL